MGDRVKPKKNVSQKGKRRSVSAIAQGLERYDSDAIHDSELRFAALRVLTDRLIKESAATRALDPVIHPGRADVIGGGSVVVQGIIDMIERNNEAGSFVISEKDILDGIVEGLVDELFSS